MSRQGKNEGSNENYRKEHLLKDGQQLIIRTPELEDAEDLINLMKALASETKFLACEADENSMILFLNSIKN